MRIWVSGPQDKHSCSKTKFQSHPSMEGEMCGVVIPR